MRRLLKKCTAFGMAAAMAFSMIGCGSAGDGKAGNSGGAGNESGMADSAQDAPVTIKITSCIGRCRQRFMVQTWNVLFHFGNIKS